MDDSVYPEYVKHRLDRISSYVNGSSVELLLNAFLAEEDPTERSRIREEIEGVISPYTPQLYFSERPLLSVPRPEQLSGQIRLGQVVQGDRRVSPFVLETSDLTKHLVIYAQSGHGKTTILFSLMSQLTAKRIPFLYFDLKKDARALLRIHPDLIVIPWKQFRWNPLRNPPGVDLKSWLFTFSETCGHSFGVYHAGINYLLEFLEEARTEAEKNSGLPTISRIYGLLLSRQEGSRRRVDYYDVCFNRIHALTSILGKILDCQVGIPIEDLLTRNVVLELEGLRSTEQDWIVSVILTFIYCYRIAQQHRGETLSHVIISDEAHRIWDANIENRQVSVELSPPVLDLFPTQFRDLQESLVLTTQLPSRLSHAVNANTFAKIAGNLGSGRDVFALAEVLGLEDSRIIGKLKRGEWIVKLSDRFTEPFLITTENFVVDRNVSDEEVATRLQARLPRLLEEEAKPNLSRQVQEREPRESHNIVPRVSDDAKALILDVNNHPFRGCFRRYKSLGLSGRRATIAKGELTGRRMIEEVRIRLGNYRPVTFLVPTDTGLEFLTAIGQDTTFWRYVGRVSFEHRLVTVLASYSLREAGFEVRTEAELGNLRLDILARKDGRSVAVEVVQTNGIEERKLLELLRLVDEVIVICKDDRLKRTVLQLVEQVIQPESRVRVRIETTGEFLRAWNNRRIGAETSGNKS